MVCQKYIVTHPLHSEGILVVRIEVTVLLHLKVFVCECVSGWKKLQVKVFVLSIRPTLKQLYCGRHLYTLYNPFANVLWVPQIEYETKKKSYYHPTTRNTDNFSVFVLLCSRESFRYETKIYIECGRKVRDKRCKQLDYLGVNPT